MAREGRVSSKMAKDLAKIAKDKKIKYFLISFVDLLRRAALQAGAGAGDRRHAEGRRRASPASPPGST